MGIRAPLTMETSLFRGKTVLVTGASRGLGRHIAQAFWRRGADVLMVSRSSGQELEPANESQRGSHFPVDLGDGNAAEAIFDGVMKFSGRLDVLVNNAAIIGPIGALEDNDFAQWQEAIRVNLLAPVALCRLAVQWMKKERAGSIINISGGGATSPRPFFTAYGTAKAGLVRFTETLAVETAGYGIRVNAIAPGAMNTEMHDAVLRAGPERVGKAEYRKAVEQAERGGTSPETPADLAVFLASDEAAGITGRLISAVWDPWRNLAARAGELAKSDVYTLRRIVPEDRGLAW
jgi:3-oxoacyl-[acyl-carrier protein] reductase